MTHSVPRALFGGVHASAAMSIQRALIQAQEMREGVRGLFAVRAEANPADRLAAAFEAFKAKHTGDLDDIKAAVDQLTVRDAASRLNGNAPIVAIDPEYSRTFASYVRTGIGEDQLRAANGTGERAQIQAAMSVGSGPDGGYLAPTEWDRKVQQASVALSPMRRIAQVQLTRTGAYSTLWSSNQWGSGWVGETASRPQTTGPTLSPITFASGEIYAQPAATQKLLDDSLMDLDSWFSGQLAAEFSRQEGIAFVSGDGVNKPAGFLTYVTGGANANTHPGGVLDVVASGAAAGISADSLIDFFYGLAAPYRQNATWTMNSATAAVVGKLKDGQGNYLWREAFLADQPPTMLGRPVVLDENMPNVSAGNLAIALGDFQLGYVINDRMGIRTLKDPYTAKPYVLFYTTKRVGGGVLDPRAIRLMKISAS